jgi:ankyrin repeat protein
MSNRNQAELDEMLISAVQWRKDEQFENALAQGASPNAVNTANTIAEKALHMATRLRDADYVQRLLLAGADVNLPSGSTATPLHVAALSAHVPHIATLLRHGADAKAVTDTGNTALHHAASKTNAAVYDVLLRGGVPVHALNNNSHTVGDIARTQSSKGALDEALRNLGSSIRPAALPDPLPSKAELLDVQGDAGALNPQNIGFWQQFDAIADALKARGEALEAADLHLATPEGEVHLLDYASRFFADKSALQVIGKAGITLGKADLMDKEGQPRPFVRGLAENGALGLLFTRELWQFRPREAMQACHATLRQHFGDDKTRNQTKGYFRLQVSLPPFDDKQVRGR